MAKDRESEIEYTGKLQELKPYSVAHIRGYSYGPKFDAADYLKKRPVDSTDQVLDLVASKRSDLGIVDPGDAKDTQFPGVLEHLVFLDPPLITKKIYIGFSKAKNIAELARQFAATMETFKRTQQYRDMLKRYGAESLAVQ